MRATATRLAVIGAILVALAVSAAPAMARAHPSAAARTLKQIAALKKETASLLAELVALQSKAVELEAREGPAPLPGGPAGGNLAGSYPNPTVKAGAVSSEDLLDSTLQAEDFVPGSLVPANFAPGALGSEAIADGQVGLPLLAAGSVGAPQLGSVEIVRSPPKEFIAPGKKAATFVICPAGEVLIGGGVEWEPASAKNFPAGLTVTNSEPQQGQPVTTWTGDGINSSGELAFFNSIAVCLRAG